MVEEIEMLEGGAASLWNEKIKSFDARDTKSGEWTNCVSNASFLCWYAGIDQKEQSAQLERVLDAVKFGVPSHDPESPKFDGRRYWRGPTWAVVNFLIGIGLEEMEHPLAERVREATRQLITEFGLPNILTHMTERLQASIFHLDSCGLVKLGIADDRENNGIN